MPWYLNYFKVPCKSIEDLFSQSTGDWKGFEGFGANSNQIHRYGEDIFISQLSQVVTYTSSKLPIACIFLPQTTSQRSKMCSSSFCLHFLCVLFKRENLIYEIGQYVHFEIAIIWSVLAELACGADMMLLLMWHLKSYGSLRMATEIWRLLLK